MPYFTVFEPEITVIALKFDKISTLFSHSLNFFGENEEFFFSD